MSFSALDQYETLDVIGNGSFGIIRKVRRKSDGMIFARKELNFERMNERDRRQIVAEVNILKDLAHDHIVRYHDRYVDRGAGILYILMEYCGGGDLSTVVKQATRTSRPIPEDKVWNYFLQILLALNHCHHPNARNGSGSSSSGHEVGSNAQRAQVLHRDLKPDNAQVFLDTADKVKLGDFGLSRTLTQANFANTYVGTPYYMSPELMQEKAYDTKSDIWSLGCVIYELCALKPPFHEAKTHQELANCIKNGRIPPLPKNYSQTLSNAIKSMLHLNPAMRPSAAQLLQHERISLTFKVTEAEKILNSVKAHRNDAAAKERALNDRETLLLERESQIAHVMSQKEAEIMALRNVVTSLQDELRSQQSTSHFTQHQVELTVKEAVSQREEELRVLVTKREKEVAEAIARREEEIMAAVRKREEEVCEAWVKREEEMRREFAESVKQVEERVEWIREQEEQLRQEEHRLNEAKKKFEGNFLKWEEGAANGRRGKGPLEEVKNIIEPLARLDVNDTPQHRKEYNSTPRPSAKAIFPSLATPIARPTTIDSIPSAMKGVVLTSTGEILATPTPAELTSLFKNSPKVGLDFTKIFDFDDGDDDFDEADNKANTKGLSETRFNDEQGPPPSPTHRKEKQIKDRDREPTPSSSSSTVNAASQTLPSRIRKPSIRSRPSSVQRATTLPKSTSVGSSSTKPKPLSHPHLTGTTRTATVRTRSQPAPEYDLEDEENLPSPFIKRSLENATARPVPPTSSQAEQVIKRRPSSARALRATVAANAAGKRVTASSSSEDVTSVESLVTRPALTSARKAGEEARKALSRP